MTDLRLELVAVPVSDVDAAIAFYTQRAGFVLDHDHRVDADHRFVQLTPPGSACSIHLVTGPEEAPDGSVRGLQLVTEDAEAARATFAAAGLDVGEVADLPWGRFMHFADPDGNTWAVQQIPPR